jgi:hypothetical protein
MALAALRFRNRLVIVNRLEAGHRRPVADLGSYQAGQTLKAALGAPCARRERQGDRNRVVDRLTRGLGAGQEPYCWPRVKNPNRRVAAWRTYRSLILASANGSNRPKRKLLLSFGTGELRPIAAVHGALDGPARLSHLL